MPINLPCKNMQFTASIFFNLLLDTRKNPLNPGDNYNNIGKLSQAHMFYDLNQLTNHLNNTLGNFEGLMDNNTNRILGSIKNASGDFRLGKFYKKNSVVYIFNDSEIVDEFDYEVKNQYQKIYIKAVQFAERYFDDNKSLRNDTLVRKALYLILNDNSIEEHQKFYICSNGSSRTKSDIRNMIDFEFEAFILGVWHYLISSQRLQTKIEKNQKISVDINYKQLNINLEYNHMKAEPNKGATNHLRYSISKLSASKNENSSPEICNRILDYYPSELDIRTDIISILEKEDITLSRSIFFKFLSENIQTIHPKRNKNAIEKLFLDLISITIENDCKLNPDKSYLLFHHNNFEVLKAIYKTDGLNDRKQIDKFSVMVKNHYQKILSEVIKIRRKYFNSPEKNEDLVVEIIEFIKNDSSIQDSQKFYVCSDGTHLTKEQLCDIEELEFEPFLLGIWHYVVSLLDSKDNADKHTFDAVFKLNYVYSGKECEQYRLGNIISEQSEMFVELEYIDI